jgi:hypothetical protein
MVRKFIIAITATAALGAALSLTGRWLPAGATRVPRLDAQFRRRKRQASLISAIIKPWR